MTLEKLGKKLLRDLKASPLKAAVLGLLVLAGLYFWGPLLWRWTLGSNGAGSEAVATLPPAPAEALRPAVATLQPAGPGWPFAVNWFQVADQRERDRLTKPADFVPTWTNPFASVQETRPIPVAETQATEPIQETEEITPAAAGLVLEGVMIGASQKRAIISGKIYNEGQAVRPVKKELEDKNAAEPFVLVRLSRRSAQLQRGGKSFLLTLETPSINGTDSAGSQ